MIRTISADEAARYLVGQLGLRQDLPASPENARTILDRLRCIQLDPLDRIGTNADLVLAARLAGARRGDVWSAIYPGHGFEHFAKERCVLPARAFPYWRDQAVETPWWRGAERGRRVPAEVVTAVEAWVRANGPVRASDLPDHGAVEAIDWSGWKGTSKAATMALEILWTQCRVVTCRRAGRDRWFDVPERALPSVHGASGGDFVAFALEERVEAAGMLSRAGGPVWSMLTKIRTSDLVDREIAAGRLDEVRVAGSPRTYLVPAGALDRTFPEDDGRMRILGPLDPVLWDRKLVSHAFGFDYVWEVYKPEKDRRWGWYVVPLLHRGRLVGRMDARRDGDRVVVEKLWKEAPDFDDAAFADAIDRLTASQ